MAAGPVRRCSFTLRPMATTSESRSAVQADAARPGVTGLALLFLAAVALRPILSDWLDAPGLSNWATIFVAITVQAVPFLVLGVTVSGAIAAFVPAGHPPSDPAAIAGARRAGGGGVRYRSSRV